MHCSQCNTDIISEANFCEHCGFQLKSEQQPILWTGVRRKICSNCFFPSYKKSIFCIRCGQKLPETETLRQSYVSQEKVFAKILVASGVISETNRVEIESLRSKSNDDFMDVLIKYQFAKEHDVLTFLSKVLNIPFVSITQFTNTDKSLMQLIPEGVARRQNVCVVGMDSDMPIIAMSDPLSIPALTELKSIIAAESNTVICIANDIKKALDIYYPKRSTPPKASSASQIDAYDVDSFEIKPVSSKSETIKMDNIPYSSPYEKKEAKLWPLYISLVLLMLIGGGGLVFFYHFKDELDIARHLSSGNQYYNDKNYSASIKEFQYYLKYKTDDIDIHFKLGRALYENENYGDAIDHFSIVLHQNPQSAEAHFYAGLSNFHYTIYGQAIDELKKALDLNPRLTDANKYIGIASINLGDNKTAIAYLEKTIKANPSNIGMSIWLSKAYLNNKSYQKVIELSQKILHINPQQPEVLYALGYAKAATGNYKDAIVCYRKSGIFAADVLEKNLKKAYSLMQEKNYDEAISEYIKVLSIKENDSESYNNLSIIYQKKGYQEASRETFKKAKNILRLR